MTETLLLQERVKNTIQLGESHFREFKSALEGAENNKKPRLVKVICLQIGEALVAFANADGGELLVGVEDDGTITGLQHSEEDIKLMLDAVKTHVHIESELPLTAATKLTIDGKSILFFSVLKGTTEVFQLPDGRCVKRKDKSTIPATIRQVLFERQEVKSREYDRMFVDGATVADLDTNLIQTIADNYLRGLSVERYLQQIGLAEYAGNGLRLRMAALLLFAKDSNRWHPRSQVRILKVNGTELKSGDNYNVQLDELAQGNIFELLIKAWEALRPFLAYKTEFGSDARFEQRYIYPEYACREAIVNAIAHRDYSIQNGVDVFIYDDRMEIKSPGALLSTLTINDLAELRGVHESRNSLIAKVLRENKFMRELGEGMKRIFELMEENELSKPVLESDSTSFNITLTHKSVFSTRQEQWLSLFGNSNLSNLQKKIVVLGMDDREISPAEIYRAINTDDRNIYDKEVSGLRKTKILVEIKTNPAATMYAKKHKIPKAQVPRFKIETPSNIKPVVTQQTSAVEVQDGSEKGVFIFNIPDTAVEAELVELFSTCGKVTKIDLPTYYSTGTLRGFGFVWFDNASSAIKAIKSLNKYIYKGFSIGITKYIPRK